MKERIIIAAVDDNSAIGCNGELLVRIPDDLKRFKELTTNNIVIMGRKTYESIGKPLPNRQNIIVSRSNIVLPDCSNTYIVDSIKAAFELAESLTGDKVYIIGGGQIYDQTIDWVDTIELTEIYEDYPNADTFFPVHKMKGHFKMTNHTLWYMNAEVLYRFATYKRIITIS